MDKRLDYVQALVYGLTSDDKSQISDGFHTFDELYYHRMILFATICNNNKKDAWKSKQHDDGSMYSGYFVVGIRTPEGDYTYHYKLEYWDIFEIEELEKAPKWDGHKPEDISRLLSLTKPSITPWLKREIDIACAGEDSYGKAVYNSAVKAYMSLHEDGHSGCSIVFTRDLLNRMIAHKPLKPLTGEDDEWSKCADLGGAECESWQNNRCSSVFKHVYKDGRVEYSDVDQFVFVNVNDDNDRFYSGYLAEKVREMCPITMPYIPRTSPIYVYVEVFLTDESNGDFDTQGVLYYMCGPKKISVNRFFHEKDGTWVEISQDEYLQLKNKCL